MIKWLRSFLAPPTPPPAYKEVREKLEAFTVKLDLTYLNDMKDAVLDFSTEHWAEVSPGIGVRLIECHNWTGTMAVVHAVAGSKFPPHTHPHPERLFFIDGKGSDPISGQIMHKGDNFLAKPYQLHALDVHEDSVMVVSWKFNLAHEAV